MSEGGVLRRSGSRKGRTGTMSPYRKRSVNIPGFLRELTDKGMGS